MMTKICEHVGNKSRSVHVEFGTNQRPPSGRRELGVIERDGRIEEELGMKKGFFIGWLDSV